MDWIDVSIEGINSQTLSRETGHEAGIALILYLSCASILWESIQQLHRVFIDSSQIPFEDEASIFKDKAYQTTDNRYFQTIRSCFQAHPVNLKDFEEETEKRFAAWPSANFGKGDLSTILYSNVAGKQDIYFDIHFDELHNFLSQRYEHLTTIADAIGNQEQEYIKLLIDTPIEKSDDPVEQINTLCSMLDSRLCDGYSYDLERFKVLFEAEITNTKNLEVVSAYRQKALKAICKIYSNMQSMDYSDESWLQEIEVGSTYNYYYSKFCDLVFGGTSSWGLTILPNVVTAFTEQLQGIVDLSAYSDISELYTLIETGLYAKKQLAPSA